MFVLGDDYTGDDFDYFLNRVDLIMDNNNIDRSQFRLHAVGFEDERQSQYPERFGILMRALTCRYNGVHFYVSTSPPAPVNIGRSQRYVETD